MMDQRIIDDISDLLQGRNGEHRKYPFGRQLHRPDPSAYLPVSNEISQKLIVDFGSEDECKRFFEIFRTLGKEAHDRTMIHLMEVGSLVQ